MYAVALVALLPLLAMAFPAHLEGRDDAAVSSPLTASLSLSTGDAAPTEAPSGAVYMQDGPIMSAGGQWNGTLGDNNGTLFNETGPGGEFQEGPPDDNSTAPEGDFTASLSISWAVPTAPTGSVSLPASSESAISSLAQ